MGPIEWLLLICALAVVGPVVDSLFFKNHYKQRNQKNHVSGKNQTHEEEVGSNLFRASWDITHPFYSNHDHDH